jgi:hypothetical protein
MDSNYIFKNHKHIKNNPVDLKKTKTIFSSPDTQKAGKGRGSDAEQRRTVANASMPDMTITLSYGEKKTQSFYFQQPRRAEGGKRGKGGDAEQRRTVANASMPDMIITLSWGAPQRPCLSKEAPVVTWRRKSW